MITLVKLIIVRKKIDGLHKESCFLKREVYMVSPGNFIYPELRSQPQLQKEQKMFMQRKLKNSLEKLKLCYQNMEQEIIVFNQLQKTPTFKILKNIEKYGLYYIAAFIGLLFVVV